MTTSVFFRFTDDIYRDLEKGYSTYFRTGEAMAGLCAWSTGLDTMCNSMEEIEDYCKQKAESIARNSYGGYSSDCEVAILVGRYVGSGNDGVLIKDAELLTTFTL